MPNKVNICKLSDTDKIMSIPKNPHTDMPLEQFIELVRAGVDIAPLMYISKDKPNSIEKTPPQKTLDSPIEVPQEQLDELSLSKYNNNASIRRK